MFASCLNIITYIIYDLEVYLELKSHFSTAPVFFNHNYSIIKECLVQYWSENFKMKRVVNQNQAKIWLFYQLFFSKILPDLVWKYHRQSVYKSPKDLSYMQILQWIWVRGLVINADIFHKVLKASKMYWSQLKVVLFPTFFLHVLRPLE